MIINTKFFEPTTNASALTQILNALKEYSTDSSKKLEILFVSVPMNGKSLDDIQKEFICMAYKILAGLPNNSDLFVIPSIVKNEDDAPLVPRFCIADSIKLMSYATIVSIPYNHYNTRGCKFEQEYAMNYLLPDAKTCIVYQPKFDKDDLGLQWYTGNGKEPYPPKFGSLYGRIPFAPDTFFVSHYTIENEYMEGLEA